mgnify:CR=1 FL=1
MMEVNPEQSLHTQISETENMQSLKTEPRQAPRNA